MADPAGVLLLAVVCSHALRPIPATVQDIRYIPSKVAWAEGLPLGTWETTLVFPNGRAYRVRGTLPALRKGDMVPFATCEPPIG